MPVLYFLLHMEVIDMEKGNPKFVIGQNLRSFANIPPGSKVGSPSGMLVGEGEREMVGIRQNYQ